MISAASAPRKNAKQFENGTTIASPNADGDGRKRRSGLGAAFSTRVSPMPNARPTKIAIFADETSALIPPTKAFDTLAQTIALGAGQASPPSSEIGTMK